MQPIPTQLAGSVRRADLPPQIALVPVTATQFRRADLGSISPTSVVRDMGVPLRHRPLSELPFRPASGLHAGEFTVFAGYVFLGACPAGEVTMDDPNALPAPSPEQPPQPTATEAALAALHAAALPILDFFETLLRAAPGIDRDRDAPMIVENEETEYSQHSFFPMRQVKALREAMDAASQHIPLAPLTAEQLRQGMFRPQEAVKRLDMPDRPAPTASVLASQPQTDVQPTPPPAHSTAVTPEIAEALALAEQIIGEAALNQKRREHAIGVIRRARTEALCRLPVPRV